MASIVIVALIITNVIQAFIHYFERRDMLNRLMSKNYTEYRQDDTPPRHIPSAHERTLNRWRNKAGDE